MSTSIAILTAIPEPWRGAIMALMAERDALKKALEDTKDVILSNCDDPEEGYKYWVDERPYICEESAYRRLEAFLKKTLDESPLV